MSQPLANKTIVILVAHEYEDIELLYPILRLSEEGARIIVVPLQIGFHTRPYLSNKPVTGRFGHPVPIPVMPPGQHYQLGTLQDLQPENIDCVLLPGGFSPDYLRRDKEVLQLINRCHNEHKILAAICHAPWVLISAGVMSGKQATGVSAVKDDLNNAGAQYLDQPVIIDGNIITSRTPNDLPQFCQAIIKALSNQ